MTFLVDNLQYYLMEDVLDTQVMMMIMMLLVIMMMFVMMMSIQITSLTDKLARSTSFEEVRRDHEVFLSTVSSHLFLHNQPVARCLRELLGVCLQFCAAAGLGSAAADDDLVRHLSTSFRRQAGLLLQLLTSLRHHLAGGSHLAQLLLRIDFNR